MHSISSSQIENALSLSPSTESSLFVARQYYDLVIIYDRSSSALPQSPPTNTTSPAQRALYNLTTAIYEREFTKSLKRQPMLLRGGWEAWERQVGALGSIGTQVRESASRRGSTHEGGTEVDAKKAANRRVAVLPGSNGYDSSVVRNGGTSVSSTNPYVPLTKTQGVHHPQSSNSIPYNPPSTSYNSSLSNYPQSFSNGGGALPSGLASPRLAMPPVAAQLSRNGSVPEYDPFVPLSSSTSHSYSQYNGYAMQNSSSGSSSAVPRTRSDLQDLSAYSRGGSGDYSKPSLNYSRPSIDYPQIGSRQAPPVNEALRPHRPAPAPPPSQSQSLVPSVPLTRPPLAKPAPMRSNSSFSSMHLPSYSSSHSQFPTTNMSFDDSMIGLSGLKNLGNTCYMNSTIQCLSAAIPFARYFKSEYSQPVLSFENSFR